MNALVINCGSSSIKADVIQTTTGRRSARMRVERVGTPQCVLRESNGASRPLGDVGHAEALALVLAELPDGITVVGHRVVHGGAQFSAPVRIDDSVEAAIEALIPLAPLHNPANLAGIRAARAALGDVPHIAVFDTAFHSTLPRRAHTYALDPVLTDAHGVRRYGFHGPSHAWVSHQAAIHLGSDVRDLRIVTCHLGNGASTCAVEFGRSVETSMGMTPLEGLVMGTRSGDVDPGAVLAIARAEGLDLDAVDSLLNKRSGLAGLSGTSGDMRDIESKAAEGDDRCRLAIGVFAHRVRKYIGAYAAAMGGVDAIVFTAGIGQNSSLIRHRIAQRLDFLGARLDEDKNRDASVDASHPVAEISEDGARVRLLVVHTDEERAIAEQAAALALEADKVGPGTIPVAISARHVHLTEEAMEVLFGPGKRLTSYKPISQPGQFAAHEKVSLIGPKRRIDNVRAIGPERSKVQVEISRTDEFYLGIDAPIRNSGDVANSAALTLEGPAGSLVLTEGVICARRHIHMHPDDAQRFGVNDRDVVEVAIDSEGRDLVFGDVLVRVKPSYVLEMHIDTDEANAAELTRGVTGTLVATGGKATIRRREVSLGTPDSDGC